MDLEDLRTFVEVADTGGISSGARRFRLPKSIISRRLARLEKALGVRLLSRTTRGAVLTEAGAILRERAARVAAELDAAQEAMSPKGDLRGHLRILAPLSYGVTHFAAIFAELAHRHPMLHVHAAYADRFVDLVGAGFDVAVRLGYLRDSSLIARRVCAIRGKFVASPHYIAAHGAPVKPDDLLGHEALMQGTESWPCTDRGKIIVVRPNGRFKADNGVTLLAAALAGLGVARLPDFLIEPHVVSGALIPVLTDYPPPEGGLFVIRPPGEFVPRKVRVLTETLVERFGGRLNCLSL